MKTGYSIKTWKMRLFCPEKQMIEITEALYREAVAFYYELLKESEELWAENLLTIQGHLEKLTVPGRDGREPKYIPPGGKLPVYFRRSAMNKAAMAVKTAASAESFPEKIDANITFFKGMYRDLTDTSVVLKLWNGKKWIWVPCGLTGRPFPKEATILSPTLVHEEKWLMFHVPVKQENFDARTAKERMQEGARVCSVRFTNTDSFAVCCVHHFSASWHSPSRKFKDAIKKKLHRIIHIQFIITPEAGQLRLKKKQVQKRMNIYTKCGKYGLKVYDAWIVLKEEGIGAFMKRMLEAGKRILNL